jgi:hypothetical protein
MPQEEKIFPRRDHGSNPGLRNFMALVRIMDTGLLAIASVLKSGGFALPAKHGGGLTAFQQRLEGGGKQSAPIASTKMPCGQRRTSIGRHGSRCTKYRKCAGVPLMLGTARAC